MRNERGVSMVEYAVVLAVLVFFFVAGATLLQQAASERADASSDITENNLPCSVDLTPEQCK